MTISPPRAKGPALNALRAFEAAARLGSFTLAADELCVTPGAVAQHVKTLEAWSNAPLFIRQAQGVVLTDLGKDILPSFVTAFDHLGEAIHNLKSQAAPGHIKIAALPSIAQLWLTPKLPEIRSHLPDVQISITAQEEQPNLSREPFDMSIFYGIKSAGDQMLAIEKDIIFPVCAPKIAASLVAIEDMLRYPLLYDLVWYKDWQNWLAHYLPDTKVDLRGPSYSLYSLAVEEAVQGAGILMARQSLVVNHLKSGALYQRPY